MALSAFDDKSKPPTPDELRGALGPAFASWTKLLALAADRYPSITPVWKFTAKSTGWGMRLVDGQRVIFYMTPQHRQFLVSFVLGERAAEAARSAKLPAAMQQAIDAAPRYAEGRGVRFTVSRTSQLPPLIRLADIKRES